MDKRQRLIALIDERAKDQAYWDGALDWAFEAYRKMAQTHLSKALDEIDEVINRRPPAPVSRNLKSWIALRTELMRLAS